MLYAQTSVSPGGLWLAFPVHFLGLEICIQYPTVQMRLEAWVRGYTHGPILARFSHLFKKKLASLKFAAAQGLCVRVYRRTENNRQAPAPRPRQQARLVQLLQPQQPPLFVSILPGRIQARTNSPECPNPNLFSS